MRSLPLSYVELSKNNLKHNIKSLKNITKKGTKFAFSIKGNAYGLTYKSKTKMRVALIPQGYADGFPRSLSNKGLVLIGGQKCNVLGRVSMNMIVVDVTSAQNVSEGDDVVLLGNQKTGHISAEEMALLSNTINYEATTRISPLLPRIVV